MIRLRPQPPETRVLIASLCFAALVIVMFVVNLNLAYQRELDESSRRTHHFALMVAENTARTFEVVEIVLRELAADLSRTHEDWQSWPEERAWEYLAQRHSKSLTLIKSITLVEADGDLKASSRVFPSPRVRLLENPAFVEMSNGRSGGTFGPYVGSTAQRYVYGMGRRIDGAGMKFSGALMAEIDPVYMQDFCWPARLAEDFEAVLVNPDQRVISTCRPSDLSAKSAVIGSDANDTLFGGVLRGELSEPGVHVVRGYIVAVSRVPAFTDLTVITAVPTRLLMRNWLERRDQLLGMAALITLFILISGWLLRRHLRSSAEVTRNLAENQSALEATVASATAELVEQRNAAERANRAKSRFLAAASHDLRQPLHALALFSSDLVKQVSQGQTSQLPRLADQIASSTKILGELLDSLLDLSRLDVQGIHPEIVHFPLQPVFDRILGAQRRAALERQIDLRFRATAHWLHSDPGMIERMLANLVANAVRYVPQGGRVLVLARRAGGRIRIEVRDNGRGIPKEHQEAIFAEFYQVDNSAREQGKGLGLGLSIVDRLARALKIPVGLRSLLGRGTVFSLSVEAGDPAQRVVAPAREAVAAQVHLLGLGDLAEVAEDMLAGWGYRVQRHPAVDDLAAGGLPGQGWIILPMAQLAAVDALGTIGATLIVLASAAEAAQPPGGIRNPYQVLTLPLRPAKLRALLRA